MGIKQGHLENTILNALWYLEENGHDSINVSDIQLRINLNSKKWAYTTVKTVLDRLVEKMLTTRYKQGNRYYYKSTVSRILAGEEAIRKVLSQYYNDDIDEMVKAAGKVQSDMTVYSR